MWSGEDLDGDWPLAEELAQKNTFGASLVTWHSRLTNTVDKRVRDLQSASRRETSNTKFTRLLLTNLVGSK